MNCNYAVAAAAGEEFQCNIIWLVVILLAEISQPHLFHRALFGDSHKNVVKTNEALE